MSYPGICHRGLALGVSHLLKSINITLQHHQVSTTTILASMDRSLDDIVNERQVGQTWSHERAANTDNHDREPLLEDREAPPEVVDATKEPEMVDTKTAEALAMMTDLAIQTDRYSCA